jgi:hypothetical protein
MMNIRSHLKQRHLNTDLHPTIIDEETNTATFLLYTLTGKLAGYQQYRPHGSKTIFNTKEQSKYYTYRNKSYPTVTLFGIESLYSPHKPIFLTEGIFDAARMTSLNFSALATMANDPPRDYMNFLLMLNRPIIAVCDNDKAGRKLAKFGHYTEVPETDLSDASDSYIEYLISKYIKL